MHAIEEVDMIIVLMGVTGVGKTTIGKLLAAQCDMEFCDADDFHPAANVEKMRAGIPLEDADRWPWLDRLNAEIRNAEARRRNMVLACSALKQVYRDRLGAGAADVKFVWLRGNKALLSERLAARKGHYMNPALLNSQLATLEPPTDAIVVDVGPTAEEIVAALRGELRV
jgi:gluconokinase